MFDGFSQLHPTLAVSAPSMVQWGLLLVAGVIVVAIIWSSQRKMSRAARMPNPTDLTAMSDRNRLASATRDIEELITELDDLSRRIHGRLDSRIARLETLIREADRRIADLSAPEHSAPRAAAIDVTLSAESPATPAKAEAAPDDRQAAIHRLADGGLTPAEIATELNQPLGEIELILALRRVRARAGAAGIRGT